MPELKIGEIDLNYQVIGDGTPLLFLHGLGSSGRDWEPQIDFFAEQYQVITVDIRGHGKSGKPPGPYSISLFAKDVGRLITMLGFDKIIVVGLSLGGMIAFQLSIEYPNLVSKLVLVNCEPEYKPRNLKAKFSALQRFMVTWMFGMRKIGEVLSKRLFPNTDQSELREIFVERWAENDKQAYIESMKAIMGWSIADRLGEINCPTLVIASDMDYTPVESKKTYVRKMQNARLVVIKDAHHALPAEKPVQFNEVLAAFLAIPG